MKLNDIQHLLLQFEGIVEAIEDVETIEKEKVRKEECTLRLFDGTMLKVRRER